MKILIALPSKSLSDPLLVEGKLYLSKLRPPLSAAVVFLAPKSLIDESFSKKRMEQEGTELLRKTEGYYRVALTEGGKQFSSKQFAFLLDDLSARTQKIAYIIGGAFGLSDTLIDECDATLSLSTMTLPHRLAFLMLCEQIYRVGEIMRNSPYHK